MWFAGHFLSPLAFCDIPQCEWKRHDIKARRKWVPETEEVDITGRVNSNLLLWRWNVFQTTWQCLMGLLHEFFLNDVNCVGGILHCRNHNCFFPQKPLERNALLVKSKTLSLPQSKCPHHARLPWSLIKLLPVLPCFYYSGLKQPFLNILNPPDYVFFFFLSSVKKVKI